MTLRGVFNNSINHFLIRIDLRLKLSIFLKLLVEAVFVSFFQNFLKLKMTNNCLTHRDTFQPFFTRAHGLIEVIFLNTALNFSP